MVVTELKLRESYKEKEFSSYYLEKGVILTPSAKQFLHDKKIDITKEKKEIRKIEVIKNKVEDRKEVIFKYQGVMGEGYFEKPEYMTQLYGNVLVKKNHKIICFRSKMDSFLAEFLIVEKESNSSNNLDLKEDFNSIKQFLDEIIRSEILNTPLDKNLKIFNLSLDKIREISHNPKQYFSMNHLFGISSQNKIRTLYLNKLRALIRGVEVEAVDAFVSESEVQKLDILRALNRLSSAIYIMMLKEEKGEYGD